MHSGNHWGGSLEINRTEEFGRDQEPRSISFNEWDRGALSREELQHQQQQQHLDETQQSWLLAPPNQQQNKKKKYIDLGCIVISRKALKWTLASILLAFLVIGLPIIIANALPKPKSRPSPPDNYTNALHKALLFFDAQKSGRLPRSNNISWRGNSGLSDGNDLPDVKGGLVGGYYDAGDNTKFHFPMAFSMTMLSWSVIEYRHKYEAIGEYEHVRDLIKWGTDYLLKTFNSSATKIDKIHAQVGGAQNYSRTPNDFYCWQRPEDMSYPRPVQTINAGPDLAGEMAAAFAAASIVFSDDEVYSEKLVKGAKTVYGFAIDGGRRRRYSSGNDWISPYYNSTGYFDEYMWGAAWLYYATGNKTYIARATHPGLSKNSRAFYMYRDLTVPSWDNKLPAAMLLLTRLRVFLNPGYPYEDMLRMYHNTTGLNMCSYLHQFNVFNWTKGGMILLNRGQPQPFQYATHAAFLASLYVDYMNATGVPGWYCGSSFISLNKLRSFATSQIDYILGKNPLSMSYVVGFGTKFPRHVHHRGASTPKDGKKYSCTGGWKWRDNSRANPNNITGAMVGGPDKLDRFQDTRTNRNYTEATMAGNAGLVAALVSLTDSGGPGIEKNTIFSAIPPLYPMNPPPPPPWRP